MAIHDRARRSRVYLDALKLAKEYLQNPEKLDSLLNRAGSKADERKGRLNEAWQQVQLLIDMLRSHRRGEYKDLSSKSLMLIIAALLYFIMPADLIPDFLIGLGYIDDVALLAWTVRSISGELNKFAEWRKIQTSAMGPERAKSSRARPGLLIEGEIT
ncbi:MAG: YkvA family protein [Pseudomonadales bacterium]